jgi:lipopolysaccharide assembly protein A
MRLVGWLFRAFIFFTLFAFALNNQHTVVVNWFFGLRWATPMVIVVLVAFAVGCAVGVVAMLPGWWQRRRAAASRAEAAATATAGGAASRPAEAEPGDAARGRLTQPPSTFGPEHPQRAGL